jgi:hypothetical protein
MKNIHEKSPCCGENVWHINKKRRQCSKCKKTWRVWKKQTGRKKRRCEFNVLFRYLNNECGSMHLQAQKKNLAPSTIHARMTKLAEKFNKETTWPEVPKGDLIAIADAMIEYINKIPHVVYFILLRSVSSSVAVITPVLFMENIGEGKTGWERAFNSIPSDIRNRIKAVVCDGVYALSIITRNEGWILQRCQFHVLASLVHHCSPSRFGKRPKFGKRILKLANTVLKTKKDKSLENALFELDKILKNKITARGFKSVIRGFIKNYQDHRAYLNYPKLNLPTTSNSIENFIGQIRFFQSRARGFRSLKSISMWIETLCKYKKKVTCNPKIYIPN